LPVTVAQGSPLHSPVAGSHPFEQGVSVSAYAQLPVATSQVPVASYVCEMLPSQFAAGGALQTFGAPAQVPSAAHTSTSVQGVASSQTEPAGFSS